MDFTLEALTFKNRDKAYEIDRADIPEAFVDDVPTLLLYQKSLKGRHSNERIQILRLENCRL